MKYLQILGLTLITDELLTDKIMNSNNIFFLLSSSLSLCHDSAIAAIQIITIHFVFDHTSIISKYNVPMRESIKKNICSIPSKFVLLRPFYSKTLQVEISTSLFGQKNTIVCQLHISYVINAKNEHSHIIFERFENRFQIIRHSKKLILFYSS